MKKISFILITLLSIMIISLSGCGSNSPAASGGGGGGATTIPTVPTGVTISPASGQNTITWTAVTGATSYNIYVSTTASTTATINGSSSAVMSSASSSYVHTNLTNGITYYYAVTAANGAGESGVSAIASGTPIAPVTIPAAPTGVTATPASSTQIDINWTLAAGATEYNIYRSTAPGVTISPANKINGASVAAGPFGNSGLTPSTTYYYIVTAVNAVGESPASVEFSATTSAPPLPPLTLMGGTMQGRSLTLAGTVTTFAGVSGFIATAANASYSDGIGAAARFYQPYGITTDGTNLYIADSGNQIIRKIVIATQQVSTIAGTASSAGNINGIGTGAKFNWPLGITTDGTNLYVSDSGNNTIRKIVIATNEVTTLCGSGVLGSTDGASSTAQFNGPGAITTDGTNLYVIENTANVIRKVVISTGQVSTIATTPATGTFTCLTTDGTNLYTSTGQAVYKIVIATGQVTLIAGTSGTTGNLDGTGAAARFNLISGITTDGTNLYTTDINNNNVRKIVISTGVVTTVSGFGWLWPRMITSDGSSLYVAQQDNNCVSKIQ